ncbi:MAG: hypothetical protein B5766_00540 [Candidatus Lumbricidophila eiseniae]|uniref:Uncharacterized protein n=1 Tax=Candidatus Lumbricidiphila eiseniae TaxID=1969409 RepID=A0A2A6FUZ9_9MICO|nr:MAG: hypothetical protein B5766_00540 [Candidatus Lumbricidophila eiseniae]
MLYSSTFFIGCSVKESSNPGPDYAYKDIEIVADDGTSVKKTFEGVNRNDSRSVNRSNDNTTNVKTCADIAAKLNGYARDFKRNATTRATSATA